MFLNISTHIFTISYNISSSFNNFFFSYNFFFQHLIDLFNQLIFISGIQRNVNCNQCFNCKCYIKLYMKYFFPFEWLISVTLKVCGDILRIYLTFQKIIVVKSIGMRVYIWISNKFILSTGKNEYECQNIVTSTFKN